MQVNQQGCTFMSRTSSSMHSLQTHINKICYIWCTCLCHEHLHSLHSDLPGIAASTMFGPHSGPKTPRWHSVESLKMDIACISRSIVVSIRACHVRDPGSIPGARVLLAPHAPKQCKMLPARIELATFRLLGGRSANWAKKAIPPRPLRPRPPRTQKTDCSGSLSLTVWLHCIPYLILSVYSLVHFMTFQCNFLYALMWRLVWVGGV